MKNRKLFVWTGFAPDYSSGLAFAIATDETQARKQIVASLGYEPTNWGDLQIHRITERTKIAFAVHGGG